MSNGNVIDMSANAVVKVDAASVSNWSCTCGCVLFYLTTEGIRCSNCSKMQEFPDAA